jgi:hypothetical protein
LRAAIRALETDISSPQKVRAGREFAIPAVRQEVPELCKLPVVGLRYRKTFSSEPALQTVQELQDEISVPDEQKDDGLDGKLNPQVDGLCMG